MFDNLKGHLEIIGDIFASLGMKVHDGKNGPYVWDFFFFFGISSWYVRLGISGKRYISY